MKVLIAGDFAPVARLSQCFQSESSESVLEGVKDIIDNVDYAIVNLEAPLAVGDNNKIKKSGPHLSSSQNAIKSLKKAGFNACSLANNHMRDYGEKGVASTIEYIKKIGLDAVGAGENLKSAQEPLCITIDGLKIGVISACENEFSIAGVSSAGSSPLDSINICYQIKQLKETCKYVLVICHGGHEYFHYPSPRMKKLYRFFIDMGADAVINHHQHCISGYEIYKSKPIVYGLGNFCFDRNDKRYSEWNDGYMAILYFDGTIKLDIVPYTQCNEEPRVILAEGTEKSRILKQIANINEVISDDERLNSCFLDFIRTKKKKNIMAVFSPYLYDKFRIAAGHHYLPYLLPKSKVRAMLNMIECETHFDETITILKDYLDEY